MIEKDKKIIRCLQDSIKRTQIVTAILTIILFLHILIEVWL